MNKLTKLGENFNLYLLDNISQGKKIDVCT